MEGRKMHVQCAFSGGLGSPLLSTRSGRALRKDRDRRGRPRRADREGTVVAFFGARDLPEYQSPLKNPVLAPLQEHAQTCQKIPEIWEDVADKYGDDVALFDPHRSPPEKLTFAEAREKIKTMTKAFRKLGLVKGDHVSIFSENSMKWLLVDQGLLNMGAIDVVRGSAAPISELIYIYENSDSVALCVDDIKLLDKLQKNLDMSRVRFIVLLCGEKPADKIADESIPMYNVDDLLEIGESAHDLPTEMEEVRRDDVATILYTSGTTGLPKGVPLTHGNLLFQVSRVTLGAAHPAPGDIFLSVLPCWHIFERSIEYIAFAHGTQMIYSSVKTFRNDLNDHKPTILVGVPRLVESLYNTVMSRFNSGSEGRRALIRSLTSASESYVEAMRGVKGLHDGEDFSVGEKLRFQLEMIKNKPLYDIADLLIWKTVRKGLGGRIKGVVVGGGSMPMYLENFYNAAKVPVLVGYGLTETAPVLANRFPERNVPGTVGIPPPNVTLKIVDPETKEEVPDGEVGLLYARGPSVTSGYHKNKGATDKAINAEGFFDTGDRARKTPSGDYAIVGREKDIIVLSNGENIGPQELEDAASGSPEINQLEYFVSLGTIEENTAKEIQELVKRGDRESLAQREEELLPVLKPALLKEIRSRISALPSYQPLFKISDVSLVLEPFSQENGQLTQTLKFKKNSIFEVYADKIAAMYRS